MKTALPAASALKILFAPRRSPSVWLQGGCSKARSTKDQLESVCTARLKPSPRIVKNTSPKPAPSAVSRGGSPRDYMRYAMNRAQADNFRFGQGMANQALGYRGMPYIRGANSPRRGLTVRPGVYLLRQRGYNRHAPRVAWQLW
jgi:hypothetical protein